MPPLPLECIRDAVWLHLWFTLSIVMSMRRFCALFADRLPKRLARDLFVANDFLDQVTPSALRSSTGAGPKLFSGPHQSALARDACASSHRVELSRFTLEL